MHLQPANKERWIFVCSGLTVSYVYSQLEASQKDGVPTFRVAMLPQLTQSENTLTDRFRDVSPRLIKLNQFGSEDYPPQSALLCIINSQS